MTTRRPEPLETWQVRSLAIDQLKAHLEPKTTRRLLMLSSLYLLAYQLVKHAAISDLKAFLSDEWVELVDPRPSQRYKDEVIGEHDYELEACLKWYQMMDVLNSDDLVTVAKLRKERNRAAHQVADVLINPSRVLDKGLVVAGGVVLRKIGLFWAQTNMDADPQFDHVDVPDDRIQPGICLVYGMALDAFLADATMT